MPEPSSHHIQTTSRRWQPASRVSPRQAVEGTALAILGLVATAAWAAAPLAAQGVTGAAIDGRVSAWTARRWSRRSSTWSTPPTASAGRRRPAPAAATSSSTCRSVGRTESRSGRSDTCRRDGSPSILALGQRLTADFALTPAVVQLRGDHRHRQRRILASAPPVPARPDHLRQHHRPTSGEGPRLHRARPALSPGDQESQRRTLLRGPARPVQQHPDRRDQQQRSLRQRRLRQRYPRMGRRAHARSPPRR